MYIHVKTANLQEIGDDLSVHVLNLLAQVCTLPALLAQFLSITHEIYKRFDCYLSYDIRATFLDISKVFDKIEV